MAHQQRVVPVVKSVDSEDISESNNVSGKAKLTELDHLILLIEARNFFKNQEKDLFMGTPEGANNAGINSIDLTQFKGVH